MVPHQSLYLLTMSQMGSMGKTSDIETAGGGRIVIIADSIDFDGPGDKL